MSLEQTRSHIVASSPIVSVAFRSFFSFSSFLFLFSFWFPERPRLSFSLFPCFLFFNRLLQVDLDLDRE